VTRGNWLWEVTVVLLLSLGISAIASETADTSSLYINGELVVFSTAVDRDEAFYVPIDEVSPLVGAEWIVDSSGVGLLRWGGGLLTVPQTALEEIDQTDCVSLDALVDWIGADIYRIGDQIHVSATPAVLEQVEVSGKAFILRFSEFTPENVVSTAEGTIVLRFADCELDIVPRTIVLANGPFTSVRIGQDGSDCRVTLFLRTSGTLQIERFHKNTLYSVSLFVGDLPHRATETVVAADVSLTEEDTTLAGIQTTIVSTSVSEWRKRYRLTPVVDGSDCTAAGSLADRLDQAGGVVAVGWAAESGLLVIDGMPICAIANDPWALGVDLFGRLSVFSPDVSWTLSMAGLSVPVSDVNREIAYDELIVYSPGYVGTISTGGIPGTFTVIKVRDERVVSIYRGAFTMADPTATVIVASGEMKAYFAGVSLGDRIRIEYTLDAEATDYRHAVSLDGVLAVNGLWTYSDSEVEPSAAWCILATDWLGTFLATTLTAQGEDRLAASDVAAYLEEAMPGLKNVWILGRAEPVAQAFSSDGFACTLGGSEPISVALCLVPIDE